MSSTLSINSNVSSLKAQRQLGSATSSLSSSFEKLSSGLRIDKASDDAAGLAVASSLKADTRIYSQGVRNLNDGVSALNIADGALANLSSIVTRMRELAEQSANGAVGWRQRKSLDAEAQALAKEYFRISTTTDYNGLKLFDGSVQGLSLQAGCGDSGSIASSLGGALGTGTFGTSISYQTGDFDSQGLSISDLNGDGVLDLVTTGADGSVGHATIRLGNGDGTFRSANSYQAEDFDSSALSMSDVNGDGLLDLVTAGQGWVDGVPTGLATIRLGNGDGTFRSALSYKTEIGYSLSLSMSDVNSDGVLDLVTAGWGGGGRATIRLGNGDGTFRSSLSYQTENGRSNALSVSDVNGDGVLDIVTAGQGNDFKGHASIRLGNGDGTFRSSLSYLTEDLTSEALAMSDLNGDGIIDLVTTGSDGGAGWATIRLGIGDGTFRSSLSYRAQNSSSSTVALSDVNGDGVSDLVTAGLGVGGRANIRLGNGDGTFRSSRSYQTEGSTPREVRMADINGDGVLDLLTTEDNGPIGNVTIRLANARDGISPILPFSLKNQADALQALPVFKGTLDRLSMQRGQIGAFQSRLSSALNTLGSTVLEYKGAQSRVEDIDVAGESANILRQQILQQAASSVLAQANQEPALALSLLRR